MKKLILFGAAVMIAIMAFIGIRMAHAQSQTSIKQTFSSSGASTAIAPHISQFNYHTILLQACGAQVSGGSATDANTDKIYICFGTNNNCTLATAALELPPGASFGPVTVGMYTGLTGQQLSGSILFNSDISFIPASGTQCVHATID